MALTQIQQDGLSSNAFQAISANTIALLPSLAGSGIAIQANGQINSNITLTLDTLRPFLTTSNVAEGSNLYYTNARVNSFIQGNLATKANVADLTTSNVAEGSNLYYTNARVVSTITPYLTTSNVAEGSNLYYTNARAYANITAALAGNVTVGNLVVNSNLVVNAFTSNSYTTTGNINAGNVIANSAVFGSGQGGSVTGANLISATNIQGNIWINLYTANAIESSSALYYTNARVNSNVIAFLPSLAGSGIAIQANGQINNIVETLNPFLLAGM